MSKQRCWVIEGVVGNGTWLAIPGHLYDNKHNAFGALRSIRAHWKQYPKETFRLAQYARVEG